MEVLKEIILFQNKRHSVIQTKELQYIAMSLGRCSGYSTKATCSEAKLITSCYYSSVGKFQIDLRSQKWFYTIYSCQSWSINDYVKSCELQLTGVIFLLHTPCFSLSFSLLILINMHVKVKRTMQFPEFQRQKKHIWVGD